MWEDKTKKIREFNDAFRQSFRGGRVMLTAGVAALDALTQMQVTARVQSFSDFTADNDPYNEHDFGAVEVDGQKLFWKIDYYDSSLEYGSEDPSDEHATTRVLTIMLAEEY